jgi:hypothetical protein
LHDIALKPLVYISLSKQQPQSRGQQSAAATADRQLTMAASEMSGASA